jgi:hypothetical protein
MFKKANDKARLFCSKVLCGIVALLILNSSIDGPATSDIMRWDGNDYTEDLSYNEIETFYELITEGIMDMEDFVPEHDNDADDTEKQSKTPQQLIAIMPVIFQLPVRTYTMQRYPERIDGLLAGIEENHTPPPDAAIA